MALREILPDIFLYEDSCNVYIVRRGDRAIAIDFGTGKVLDELSEIGVTHLDWIIHTHHHRDQCDGDHLAVSHGTKIAVPEWEAHYFSEAEHFWGRRSIMHLYNMRTNFYTLRESVPVSAVLQDYTHFEWQGHRLEILPAPGHTQGGVAFILHTENHRVAFVGDLIRDSGQAETIHDLQYNYGGWEGMQMSIAAMGYLLTQTPHILFPSHGGPVRNPAVAVERLTGAMRSWMNFYGGGNHDVREAILQPVIPDVYFSKFTNANHYIVLSKSGKALFIDYGPNYSNGLVSGLLHADEANRFVPHSLPELRQIGMTSVDVAIPSHYHDDHITGFSYLQRKENTKIWCYKNMVDILSNPTSEIVGCTVPIPLTIDRVMEEDEEFEWEEFKFRVRYTPGHCDYHMTMFMEHAGHRIAFSGDNIFNSGNRDSDGRLITSFNLIPMNKNRHEDHLKTAETLLEFEPEILCPGHGGPFDVEREDLLLFRDHVAKIGSYLQPIVGKRSVNRALDFHWARVFPYEQAIEAGRPINVSVRIRNYETESANGTLEARLPEGWTTVTATQPIHIHAGGEATVEFAIIPGDKRMGGPSKVPFAFALELNGHNMGEVCNGIGNYSRMV